MRYFLPDKSPIVRCKKCNEEVVLVKKNSKVLFIGYKTVVMSEKDRLVGYEHRCRA